MEKNTQFIDKEIFCKNFVDINKNYCDKGKLEAIVEYLNKTQKRYPLNGTITNILFNLKFEAEISKGKSFTGSANWASNSLGGAFFGEIITDDIEKLYSKTVSFEFSAQDEFLRLIFLDQASNPLGRFEGSAVANISGEGKGRGKWS